MSFTISKTLWTLLFVLGKFASFGAAQDASFTWNYVQSAGAGSQECTNWNAFTAALTGNFARVAYGGTLLSTVTLNDAVGATNLADAIQRGLGTQTSPYTVVVGSKTAWIGTCGSTLEVSFINTGGADPHCVCGAYETFRPCRNDAHWGGLGGANCNPQGSQTMTLTFYRNGAPTAAPTPLPTPIPSEAPSSLPAPGGAGGDPHFKTWHGAQYDFHGHCDLVLLNAPHVADGHRKANQGLSIHIRSSSFKTFFSYISDVAIRIGDDVLEVGNQGKHYVNGVPQTVGATEDLAGYRVSSSKAKNKPRHVYKIHLDGYKEEIDIREYKDWISISILHATRKNFGTSSGLMGRFEDGAWVSRDNITIHKDMNEYGQDWQVRGAVDGFLFRVPSPHPKQCELLSKANKKIRLRRLEESTISQEEAMQACAHWGSEIMDCVFDVRASGDLGVASNGPIASSTDLVVAYNSSAL